MRVRHVVGKAAPAVTVRTGRRAVEQSLDLGLDERGDMSYTSLTALEKVLLDLVEAVRSCCRSPAGRSVVEEVEMEARDGPACPHLVAQTEALENSLLLQSSVSLLRFREAR